MRKTLLSGVILLALVSLAAHAAVPQKGQGGAKSERASATQPDLLARFMSDPRPARAGFTQRDERGSSKGTLVVGSRGKLRWEQSAPYPLMLVSDGQVAWQVDPDLMQATRLDAKMTEGWASMFSDRRALERQYAVKQQGRRLVLTSRHSDGVKATIEFDAGGNPAVVRLGAGPGDKSDKSTTEIRFDRWTRLDKATSKLFDYTPTQGMDIVGAR